MKVMIQRRTTVYDIFTIFTSKCLLAIIGLSSLSDEADPGTNAHLLGLITSRIEAITRRNKVIA
jgi:hypothetical protein